MTWFTGAEVAQLLIAALCGGAVGLQRQAAQKPAGFRTHLLVALGCCAFAQIGILTGDTRIAANVLTGIGFIGAGAIFRSGLTAHGLTTAASIWSTAAVGVAIAQGSPQSLTIGISVTILTVIVLSISDVAIDRYFASKTLVSITYDDQARAGIANVLAGDGERYILEGDYKVSAVGAGHVTEATYRVQMRRGINVRTMAERLASAPGVHSVSVTEPTSST
ncbi:MAG: MgtC/SapB family protein [Candidatus Eremiobacteraeota bacterium]|nr:MgtC/SapB family protein [Candidatus Eremiobacteraeota bacterium]MBV9737186.1 MgtC/SapB family protein [Candidatus Eremiobacteraeota bacterium]